MSIAADTGPRAADAGLLDDYAVPRGFDELRASGGEVRDHWAHLTAALTALGPTELRRRAREASRLLRNDGVAYNVHEDGVTRPTEWNLDPIPFVLDGAEWATVEQGVMQRAELLGLVLADLYGRRDLIRTGLLPLEVVYGHRGFLRQADQIRLPGPRQLLSYACDLARDEDGRMWVLSDFAQAPSGAGFALENRMVVSRVFPGVYRDSQVQRVAPYFRAVRAALQAVAPAASAEPRIVMLTPGSLHETYFEHSYLSTHLGYSLVEGPDLTVRDGRVWLRSLGGLDPIDVIVRRVDGWYCDSLELKPDSHLGVPGLVESARRGHVSVVNPFGSSVLENPGLLPFLPRIAEQLLGQPLALPSATTWWCGDQASRRFVLDHLSELMIKPTARRPGHHAIAGWELTAAERDDLQARIEARPWTFVAQERVTLAAAPCLVGDRLEARPVALRAFAVALPDTYAVMPGGLARVAPTSGGRVLSARQGAATKDTWVLASQPEQPATARLARRLSVARDPAGAMPSRAADNLFWLGRYAERADATVRLVRGILDRRNDVHHGTNQTGVACLDCLLLALTDVTTTYPGFTDAIVRSTAIDQELFAVISDGDRPGSLAYSLRALLIAAQSVRDHLSSDIYLVLADLQRELSDLESTTAADPDGAMPSVLAGVVRGLLALSGLTNENMVRDLGWRFLDAGRRVERGILLTSLLRSTIVPVRDHATESMVLESVLIASESIITYRRRYRSDVRVDTALELLLAAGDNPRSLTFQLARLADDLAALPPRPSPPGGADERLVLEASAELATADLSALAGPIAPAAPGSPGPVQRRLALDDLLASVQARLAHVATAVHESHFVHLHHPKLVVAGQPSTLGETLAGVMP
jgi:uncharacterized circularly permuted ATP-grasp superfamily protein/uncharacterized alpha-E superfamily protein